MRLHRTCSEVETTTVCLFHLRLFLTDITHYTKAYTADAVFVETRDHDRDCNTQDQDKLRFETSITDKDDYLPRLICKLSQFEFALILRAAVSEFTPLCPAHCNSLCHCYFVMSDCANKVSQLVSQTAGIRSGRWSTPRDCIKTPSRRNPILLP